MNQEIFGYYTHQLEKFSKTDIVLKKRLQVISISRFLTFVGLVVSLFYTKELGLIFSLLTIAILFGSFLYLVKIHIYTGKEKKRNGLLINLCKDELQALQHKFNHFKSGKEYIDPDHDFSYDLDIFGEGSLFQYLNRTSTISGQKTLGTWLQNPLKGKVEIEEQQGAVMEIAKQRDWRLKFLSIGKIFNETEIQHQEVANWAIKDFGFKNLKFTRIFILAMPILTLLSFIPIFLSSNYSLLYAFVFMQWLSMYFYRKQIKEYFRFFSKKAQLIEKYKSLLSEIEGQDFKASWLKKQQDLANSPHSASKTINRLGKLVSQFEYRQNLLAGFILNSLFLWDIRCVYHLYNWQVENKDKLMDWLSSIENIDAVISLANFADNHPEFTFPKINEGSFCLEANELGHPLLNPAKRVCSDLEIDQQPKVMIITGANMAGKSTFLRTVGVNLVLAGVGAPVCATNFNFFPIGLYTNMRTTDSLFKDESYFFAELKRLGIMLERLKKGEQLFVILDEMLKGTNSVDKLNGSRELVKKMVNNQAVALVATHDLKLAELEKEADSVVNKCFEIHIENDELTFDYTLTDGVTESMNATFLMKKMGII